MFKNQVTTFLFMILLCVSLSMTLMAATTGKISGRVTDSETGNGLFGANVVIEGTTMGAATDLSGDYFILNVSPGTYNVAVTMMGYTKTRTTDVEVSIDRTIKVDVKLKPTVIEGQAVTVVAGRDVVRMDMSASQLAADADHVASVPLVTNVQQFINLQAGVENNIIRGGGQDQVGLVVDGMTVVDNQANRPMMMVNLSALKEVAVIKGGFNAEYGNVRSGMINIVTKDGSPTTYHGSLDARYTRPALKHRGRSLFDPQNYYLRPYLDPEVCWVGTAYGMWDEYTQKQYKSFEGWTAFSDRLLADEDPSNDLTPVQARDLFIWQHRSEGSAALGHPHPGEYGNKLDYNVDASFGGPVPFMGRFLTLFGSYRVNIARPVMPTDMDRSYERNAMIKVSSMLSRSMKLGFEGMFGRTETPGGGGLSNQFNRGSYFNYGGVPTDTDQKVYGFTFDHILSPRTFYNIRASVVKKDIQRVGIHVFRDTTTLRSFGGYKVDEQPFGFLNKPGYLYSIEGQMVLGGVGGDAFDFSKVTTYNAKADMTSQIDKYNQVKAGFEVNYDQLDVYFGSHGFDPTGDTTTKWAKSPLRGGAYIQDKLEFQGMIANLGLRFDYNDPRTDWYTVDQYSKYFARQYKSQFEEKAPKEPAKGHLKISPRLGISHPITSVSKLYFNYGHFYSMPTSSDMFNINYGIMAMGIGSIGNPNAELPRTISYELGYEHEIGKMFLVSVAGYYKDVSDQTGTVRYVNYDGSVDYGTINNSNYADIRGVEIRLEKTWGRWITGWVNYNYMVQTSGYFGREVYYQDPRQQAVYGLRNPKQEKPLPRPAARANLQLMTPPEWGPTLLGMKPLSEWGANLLFTYKAGDYQTWEPVAPFKAVNNIQWKPAYNFDLRIDKRINIGRSNLTLFVDVYNVFDIEQLTGRGFQDAGDQRDYLNSLHLAIYSDPKYKAQGFTAGTDKPGDVRSKDKAYIDMPNIDFQAWNVPRSIVFGAKFDF